MPNLCPYFWKSILMWLIIPFVFLICLPDILFSLINKEKINNINFSLEQGVKYHVIIQAVISVIIFIYNIIKSRGYKFYGNYIDVYEIFGLLIVLIVSICLMILLIIFLFEKLKTKKSNKKPNLITEGIKSWYYKRCPQINWIKKEK